jgi:5-methylthioadenosine/S-adenosylhomocysteine deaminase
MKTKLKGRYVVGYNGADHVLLKDAEVVYEEADIIYVGKKYKESVDETIDCGNSVISPGFIDLNALGDIDHDILHVEADEEKSKNLLWSENYMRNGSREVMTEEEEGFKSLYAYTQLILNGITTAMPITSVFYKKWAETYDELAVAAQHAGNLGLRIYLGPSYQSATRVVQPDGNICLVWDEEGGREGLKRAVKFVEEFDGTYDGLVRGMLAPERIECQTEESLKQTKAYSEALKVPIKLHAAQGSFEYHTIIEKYGVTPIQYLKNLGFLGPKTGIPHANFIAGYSETEAGEGDDIRTLNETGTTVIHCPIIMGRRGSGLESFAKYKRTEVNIAIGTDTFPPDIFQNIRAGSMISRLHEKDVADSTFADFFRAATLGGAKFLGRDDLGRLAAGAKADIIVIDLDGYHMGLSDDPIRTMIMSGSGRDVKLSVINGKIVMKDRKIPNLDLKELQLKGQSYFEKMKSAYSERDYQQSKVHELFNPSFPFVDSVEDDLSKDYVKGSRDIETQLSEYLI